LGARILILEVKMPVLMLAVKIEKSKLVLVGLANILEHSTLAMTRRYL
jgi:hypothetical protein